MKPSMRLTALRLTACAIALLVSSAAPAQEPPRRIISMAPSATETLFALGLGDKLVGVTRYCDYPPKAKEISSVGGYVDPNYEQIVALKPDLVILLSSHVDAQRGLEKLGIETLVVPHATVNDIHKAILRLGAACGAKEKARDLVQGMERRIEAVGHKVKGMPRPRTLICIGRDTQTGQLAGMYIAGRHEYFDEVLELAGGVNAYRDERVAYPQVSAEGIISLNPDVIVDLVGELNPEGKTATEIATQWDRLRPVQAVRHDKVHVIVGDHALRPGPRYVRFVEELARLLHPEAFAEDAA
jgi:iron complex transport system substrate-binding protein